MVALMDLDFRPERSRYVTAFMKRKTEDCCIRQKFENCLILKRRLRDYSTKINNDVSLKPAMEKATQTIKDFLVQKNLGDARTVCMMEIGNMPEYFRASQHLAELLCEQMVNVVHLAVTSLKDSQNSDEAKAILNSTALLLDKMKVAKGFDKKATEEFGNVMQATCQEKV